ncbi:unnamed protein product, partial [Cyprideis torosa]
MVSLFEPIVAWDFFSYEQVFSPHIQEPQYCDSSIHECDRAPPSERSKNLLDRVSFPLRLTLFCPK